MKIGMYSPYLPHHFGGGERHFLTSAAYLSQSHQVEILLPNLPNDLNEAVKTYQSRFDLDLSAVQWRASGLAAKTQSAWANWRETALYDGFIYLTDGSIFPNGSRHGILHVQVPFQQPVSLSHRLKLKTWQVLNTNSVFTKNVIEKAWQRKVDFVHAPFVDHSRIPNSLPSKHPEILTVGRIFAPTSAGQNKRHDVLINAFIQGCEKKLWSSKTKLHIVGAVEPGKEHQDYAKHLQKLAQDWNIAFHLNVPNQEVLDLYARSEIYWHAAGFDVDQDKNPELVEHFGMTPLEAMAWGCIPIVVPKGGLTESVTPNVTGFTFTTVSELLHHTHSFFQLTPSEKSKLQLAAQESSQRYSLSRFCRTLDEMLSVPDTL